MQNYLIYDENMKLIARDNTRIEAIAAGRKWADGWRQTGCPNIRHFTVWYNGIRAAMEFDSRNPQNLPMAESAAKTFQAKLF